MIFLCIMSGTVFFLHYRYRYFFGELEPTLETEHFYIVGVNSIRRRYHTRGHISIEQIQDTMSVRESAKR